MTVSMTLLLKLCVAATMTCSSAWLTGREPLRLSASNRSNAFSRSVLHSFFPKTLSSNFASKFFCDFLVHRFLVLITVVQRASSSSSLSNWESSALGSLVKSKTTELSVALADQSSDPKCFELSVDEWTAESPSNSTASGAISRQAAFDSSASNRAYVGGGAQAATAGCAIAIWAEDLIISGAGAPAPKRPPPAGAAATPPPPKPNAAPR
mmetsp:Transcript_22472/g.45488  ORF Transcript_22472/g.45488 Transcript_22472/m.45488 type:complete len:210 (-) Transcript_22472:1919-2548(-)